MSVSDNLTRAYARVRQMQLRPIQGDAIMYWMDREIRVQDNWALYFAYLRAKEHDLPLIVVYNLVGGYLGGGYRQHAFKCAGLQEVAQTFAKKDIPFLIVSDADTVEGMRTVIEKYHVAELITDFSPLKLNRGWKRALQKKSDISMWEVDAHNIVPCWIASEKQEFAARTIRPKILRQLKDFSDLPPKHIEQTKKFHKKVPKINWKKLHVLVPIESVAYDTSWIVPGPEAALKAAKRFVKNHLEGYATDRNDAVNRVGVSHMSPYLHYGNIFAGRIAQLVREADAPQVDKDAYLEELIIRKELADNFCFYNKNYDTVSGFPAWAQETLQRHAKDPREYVYTYEQFEKGDTHDALWNAAQLEMVLTGKMHGYMRMYWAKKILEWTKDPKTAQKIAISLNDRYELDGRDPNGYVGVAWSIGGVHDRPWFNRQIFGTVRYMARSGCEKKFSVAAYIAYVQNLKKSVDKGNK